MLKLSQMFAMGAVMLLGAPLAQAVEKPQEWELVNPSGVIKQAQVEPAKRITTLEGKTVVLRWNGKNNGDLFLDKIAELLKKNIPTVKVVKSYVEDTSLNSISGTEKESIRVTEAIRSMNPDIVIAAQCD